MSSMIKSHLSIFNSFGIYTLSNIVIAASTFVIIPFMTRYLDLESLGYIFLFQHNDHSIICSVIKYDFMLWKLTVVMSSSAMYMY